MNSISEQVIERINSRPQEEAKRHGELGQEEFLELMVAQVQNQDPFNPMDNGEFIAQMAQFATVEGIGDMQTSLADLNATMKSNQALTASSVVGRAVLAPTDRFAFDGQSVIDGAIATETAASSLTLNVFDAAGALVSRLDLGAADGGHTRFSWNGRNAAGELLPAGNYTLQAEARVDGASIAAGTSLVRRIDSVTLGASLSELALNLEDGTTVGFSTVREFL